LNLSAPILALPSRSANYGSAIRAGAQYENDADNVESNADECILAGAVKKKLGLTLVSEVRRGPPPLSHLKHGLNAMDRNVLAE
jgi:hypothetical protein